MHQLGVRTIDNQGRVSATNWLPVRVYDPASIGIGASNIVVTAAICWPPRNIFGIRILVLATASRFRLICRDEVFVLGFPSATPFLLDATSLTGGNHLLGIRTMDMSGYWSGVDWMPVRLQFSPIITNQPQNLYVVAGADAAFSVGAEGAPPLSYQLVF